MGEPKLNGMKAAFDEIMATAIKAQHEPQHSRFPGEGGRIGARAARVYAAVAAQLVRLEEVKKPKPRKPARKTFAHIRDYRDAGR